MAESKKPAEEQQSQAQSQTNPTENTAVNGDTNGKVPSSEPPVLPADADAIPEDPALPMLEEPPVVAETIPDTDESKLLAESEKKLAADIEAAQRVMYTKDDGALRAAWRRLLDYDDIAYRQKKNYIDLRQIILWIAVFSSFFAALSATFFVAGSQFQTLMTVILIALPIISVSVMDYASRFAQSTVWVELRYRAEMIRSQIFLYRANAGEYYGKNPLQCQNILLNYVKQILENERTSGVATPPYLQIEESQLINEIAKRKSSAGGEKDDGLKQIMVDQFVDWRLHHQLNWYIRKVRDHYRLTKRYRILILAVSALGSILVAFSVELGVWVAVTTAAALALQRWTELRMYGATYGIYHNAALRVQDELANWQINPKRNDPEQIAVFVNSIEDIFQFEQQSWRDQAIQMLEATDDAMMNTLSQSIEKQGISYNVPTDSSDDLLVKVIESDDSANGNNEPISVG